MIVALWAAAALAVVHLYANQVVRLRAIPRSRALSVASGISVAYVFVHLLPELAAIQRELGELAAGVVPRVERHVWIIALTGLTLMYALERAARRRTSRPTAHDEAVGWVHLGSYALYNGIVGALLVERARGIGGSLVWFTVAMGVHFVVNDHGLRESHGALYHDRGRWLVAAGVLGGWALAVTLPVSAGVIGVLTALLGGGVVLNVLKEELPAARESSVGAFASGAAAYTAVLLLA